MVIKQILYYLLIFFMFLMLLFFHLDGIFVFVFVRMEFSVGETILLDNLELETNLINLILNKFYFFKILKKLFLFLVELIFLFVFVRMEFLVGDIIMVRNMESESIIINYHLREYYLKKILNLLMIYRFFDLLLI